MSTRAMIRTVMSRLLRLAVVIAALVLAPSALAASQKFWYGPYDKIGEDISGVSDLQVQMEDDPAEWAQIEADAGVPDGEALLGFAAPGAPAGSVLYHRIFVAPDVTLALTGALPINPNVPVSYIWDRIGSGALSYQTAAVAILTVIHESYHYRLNSGDEQRVNACSLRDMPTYLSTEFRIPKTITTTTQVPQTTTTTKQVPYYVTVVTHKVVKGKVITIRKKVRRYKTVTVTTTTMVTQTQTQENPAFDGIMNSATAFRASQPPPYNTGDCT
jgi:hypothetical protein